MTDRSTGGRPGLPSQLLRPADWERRALCADDPEKWFPGSGQSVLNGPIGICHQCPVKQLCLAKAMAAPSSQDYGVWGATTAMQRRHIRAGRITVEQAWAGEGRHTSAGNSQNFVAYGRALAARTHCHRGHEFTPENTRIKAGRTGRDCRKCCAERCRQARARAKAKKLATEVAA